METVELSDKVLERNNLNMAYRKVVRNKGSHGVDKMSTDQLLGFLKENGQELISQLKDGTYKPFKLINYLLLDFKIKYRI